MPIIARSFDDTLLDVLVTKLRAFSAAQAVMDPAAAFNVERDFARPVPASLLPLVNVYVASITPDPTQSGTLTKCSESMTVYLDCLARGMETPGAGAGNPVSADQVAARRVLYLKEQVRYCLYDLVNACFGLSPNPITSKKWPRWTLNPERSLNGEWYFGDGRWTLDIEYTWTPADSQTTQLTDLYAVLTNDHDAPEPGVLEHYAP